jgi:O-antigen/teichoic acid export membrane protein
MSRSKRFLAGVITGYGSIVANVVFTLASVPLALHYLDKEQFGLWALAMQIAGYLSLIDLGMSSAISRFAADHKDDVDGGSYGNNLLTGGVVFFIQGTLIAAIGISFSWFAPEALAIPNHLAGEFRSLLMILSATAGATVALRSIGAPLWAFQRSDLINGCSTVSLLINLLLLWFGFSRGFGVMSFALAPIPASIATIAISGWVCHRNGYYPSRGHWGRPSVAVFRKVFGFGKDAMLISIGSQLVNASQIIVISQWISLEAAATFSVATKFYTMSMQLVANPISASASGLTEIYVRGERDRFASRYWDMIALIMLIATVAGVSLAAGNSSMVTIWTRGAVHWSWSNDLLLGLLIVLRNINGCLVGLFGLIKDWRPVRYLYLVEGILFVPLAIFGASHFGLPGVLFASLLSHLLVTTTFSARAASAIIGSSLRLRRGLLASLVLILLASVLGRISQTASLNPYVVVVATGAVAALTTLTGWLWILPDTIRNEVGTGFASATRSIRRFFGQSIC